MVVHIKPAAVEIAASPEHVRQVVLDFANLPSWHKGHFDQIKVQGSKEPKDLVKGDKLSVALASGMKFSPVIQENSAERLKWRGSLPGIFTGDHVFEFQPSKRNPGQTTFLQYEDFSGLLAFTMKPNKESGSKNMLGFLRFNEDVKRQAESDTKQ